MTTSEMMKVEARTSGKGKSRNYRLDKKVPAVIYGPKTKNVNCLIDELFVNKHSGSRHESTIFKTESPDSNLNSLQVMLKKIQRHPLNQRPLHVDLYALDMTAKIKVHVTLDFQGTPEGVKDEGGVLQIVMRDLEIECNPTEIPESITVDVSGIKLNESLHVSDLALPAGVESMTAAERTVCNVSIPKEEPAEPVEAAAEGEGAEGAEAPAAGDAKKANEGKE